MKQFLFIIFLSLCAVKASCFASAQVAAYYNSIYSAEKNLLDGNYKGAAADYDIAFTAGVTPFAADIYNNMLAGINTADNPRILKMAKILVAKGIDTGYFRKSIFHSFRRSAEWASLLNDYASLKKQGAQTTDKTLIKKLSRMVDADQKITADYHSGHSNTVQIYKRRTDSLARELTRLMTANDYLCEDKLGIYNVDTEINMIAAYQPILLHALQLNEKSPLLGALKTAINAGKIKSGIAMNYLSYCSSVLYLNNYILVQDSLYRFQPKTAPKQAPVMLLTENPSKTEKAFRDYCYMDNPESVLRKTKYYFRIVCNSMKGAAVDQSKIFILGPSMAGVIADAAQVQGMNENAVAVDGCGPL